MNPAQLKQLQSGKALFHLDERSSSNPHVRGSLTRAVLIFQRDRLTSHWQFEALRKKILTVPASGLQARSFEARNNRKKQRNSCRRQSTWLPRSRHFNSLQPGTRNLGRTEELSVSAHSRSRCRAPSLPPARACLIFSALSPGSRSQYLDPYKLRYENQTCRSKARLASTCGAGEIKRAAAVFRRCFGGVVARLWPTAGRPTGDEQYVWLRNSSKGAECEAGPGNRRVPFRWPQPVLANSMKFQSTTPATTLYFRPDPGFCGQNRRSGRLLIEVFRAPRRADMYLSRCVSDSHSQFKQRGITGRCNRLIPDALLVVGARMLLSCRAHGNPTTTSCGAKKQEGSGEMSPVAAWTATRARMNLAGRTEIEQAKQMLDLAIPSDAGKRTLLLPSLAITIDGPGHLRRRRSLSQAVALDPEMRKQGTVRTDSPG